MMNHYYVWQAVGVVTLITLIAIGAATYRPVAQAYAQNGGNMTQPEVGQTIAWQGTVSSFKDPLKGHESHQVAVILPPRDDQAIYSGVISFIASKPVEVVTLHDYTLGNTT